MDSDQQYETQADLGSAEDEADQGGAEILILDLSTRLVKNLFQKGERTLAKKYVLCSLKISLLDIEALLVLLKCFVNQNERQGNL